MYESGPHEHTHKLTNVRSLLHLRILAKQTLTHAGVVACIHTDTQTHPYTSMYIYINRHAHSYIPVFMNRHTCTDPHM